MILRIHRCRSRGFRPLAWAIMIFQKMSPFNAFSYNHMAISYVGQTGMMKYADSTFNNGVVYGHQELPFYRKYSIVHTTRIELSASEVEFKAWIEANSGKRYDAWSIVGFVGKFLHLFKRNPMGSGFRRMTCNELVLSVISRFCGVMIGDSDDYDLIMTAELVEAL